MEFRYQKNGTYQLSYKVGTPKIPTEIRLQLQFKVGKDWHTISLPPRCFDDDAECGLKCQMVTIHGHSATLQTLLNNKCLSKKQGCHCKKGHCHCEKDGFCEQISGLRRRGTARFGYGLAGLGQSQDENKN